MNVDRIKALYSMVAGIPAHRLNLNTWSFHREQSRPATPDDLKHSCGTFACIAGWAAVYPPFVEHGLGAGSVGEPRFDGQRDFHAMAAFLGIELEEALNVFDSSMRSYERELSHKKVALRRLRDLMVSRRIITEQRAKELEAQELHEIEFVGAV